MDLIERITYDPKQCGGRPCLRGMRIRVVDVLELLAAGETEVNILQDFPDLEVEDIRACLKFAAAQANHAILKPLSPAVVWLRIGNCSNDQLLLRVIPLLAQVVDRIELGDRLVEVS